MRPARREELDDVGALLHRTYDATGPFTDDYRAFIRDAESWAAGVTEVFVAELREAPDRGLAGLVAFVLPRDLEFENVSPPAADCGFRFLAVDPAVQGRGVGRALVERCIAEGRRRGCRRLGIHSMDYMRAAHRLYERLGFRRRPDLDVRFPTGIGLAFDLDLADDAGEHFPPPGPVPDDPPWFQDAWDL